MSQSAQDGAIIMIGYEWRQGVVVTPGPTFPSGGLFRAVVRQSRQSTAALADLTSANGGVVRISDEEIELVIPAASTATMAAGSVVIDVVRTDLVPPQHLGFTLTVPVQLPVTR